MLTNYFIADIQQIKKLFIGSVAKNLLKFCGHYCKRTKIKTQSHHTYRFLPVR
jgi:hypothetical protein